MRTTFRKSLALAASCLVALAASAFAYVEIELGRFTDPTIVVVADIAARQGAGAPTAKERTRLVAFHERLTRRTSTFAEDLAELGVAVSRAKPLAKRFGTELDPALALGFERAIEEIALRRAWVMDHSALLPDTGTRPTVLKRVTKADAAIVRAGRATNPARRVVHLRAAEKQLTSALAKAQVGIDLRGLDRPPPRLRNGAEIGAAGGRIAFATGDLAGVEAVVDENAAVAPMRLTVSAEDGDLPYPLEAIGRGVRLTSASDVSAALVTPVHLRLPWESSRLGDTTITMWADVAVPGGLKPRFGVNGIVEVEGIATGVFVPVHDVPPPPHPAVVEERYHVIVFAQRTLGASASYEAEVSCAAEEADFVFSASAEGASPTGFVLSGTRDDAVRRFTDADPFHSETSSDRPVAAQGFSWGLVRTGQTFDTTSFTISFPALDATLTGSGNFSRDRRLVVFTGRSATTQVYAIGIRDGGPTVASADGPWFIAEGDITFDTGDGVTFGSAESSAFGRYVGDGFGIWLPDSGNTRSVGDVRIPVDGSAEPALVPFEIVPRAFTGLTVAANGRLSADGGTAAGWMHGGAGVFVAHRVDVGGHGVSMLVGVRDDGADFDSVFDGYAAWTSSRTHSTAGSGAGGTGPLQSVISWTTTFEGWSAALAVPSQDVFRLQASPSVVSSLTALGAVSPRWTCSASTVVIAAPPNSYFDTSFPVPSLPSQRRTSEAVGGIYTDAAVSPDGEALIFRTGRTIGFGVAR